MRIDINRLKGLAKEIAQKIDNAGNKNNIIDKGNEISLFYDEANKAFKQGQLSFNEYNSIFAFNSFEPDKYVAARDATYVAPPKAAIAAQQTKPAVQKDSKYEKVSSLVEKQLVKRLPKGRSGQKCSSIADLPQSKQAEYREKIAYITKMVIEKCEKYEIEDLAPVIAEMLGVETGGYNFTERVMKNPGRSYKGVMQVDYETCKSIYSEGGAKYVDWHKRHFSQDDQRIAELKAKYPTAKSLYNAIQEDVELGLEVGIIAFKAKIHQSKGSVAGGIAKYCGNQYKCNIPGVPSRFDVNAGAA